MRAVPASAIRASAWCRRRWRRGFGWRRCPAPARRGGRRRRGGCPRANFILSGFLPHKSGQRRKQLEGLKAVAGTLVLYESPYRLEKLLGELGDLFPARPVVLARELTKKFEEFLRGTPAQLLAAVRQRPLKGEFVVLVGRRDAIPPG